MNPRKGGKAFWQSQSEALYRMYVIEHKSTSEIGRIYNCHRSTVLKG